MLHLLQNAHLTKQAPRTLLVAEYVLVPLACVLALRLRMQDLHHSTVGTFTELFDQFELMRQLKVCIEVIEAEADLVVQSTTRCLLFDC